MGNIYLSHSSEARRVATRLRHLLSQDQPHAIGMATAFLSDKGADDYRAILSDQHIEDSRVVVGTSGAISSPTAIQSLRDNGHSVKLGRAQTGIFHPKLLVAGDRFLSSGQLASATSGYVGSANFTRGGLRKNLEVVFVTRDEALVTDMSLAFSSLWSEGISVTDTIIHDYEKAFARAQRRRSIPDLRFLEVVDPDLPLHQPNPHTLVRPPLCTAVWAGLESYTGEHRFQVEFPRRAGEAMRTLLGTRSGEVKIECSDGKLRSMKYRYYTDNGMYRLNVPNDMPLVEWARRATGERCWFGETTRRRPRHFTAK